MVTGEMTRAEMMASLGLKDEKHFREHYQQAAIALGLIEMTIPDKPTSRLRIREERGSGIDKVVSQIELFQLPAPLFESPDGFTRAVLFAHKPHSATDKADRVRACYLHACLCYVTRNEMTRVLDGYLIGRVAGGTGESLTTSSTAT